MNTIALYTEHSFCETLDFKGVDVEVTGTYDEGEPGDYESPGSGPEVTEWKTVTVGGVDVTAWIEAMNGYDELEEQVLKQLELI